MLQNNHKYTKTRRRHFWVEKSIPEVSVLDLAVLALLPGRSVITSVLGLGGPSGYLEDHGT